MTFCHRFGMKSHPSWRDANFASNWAQTLTQRGYLVVERFAVTGIHLSEWLRWCSTPRDAPLGSLIRQNDFDWESFDNVVSHVALPRFGPSDMRSL